MRETRDGDRTIVEHTSPIYRLLGVALACGAVAAMGFYFREVEMEDAFATVAAVTLVGAIRHWARKRPDRLRLRLGPFSEIGEAAVRSADRIGAWTYERSLMVGAIIYACYGVALVCLQTLIVLLLTNVYAWPLAVAVGCAIGALVAAPEFFSSAWKRMSVPDEDEEPEPVEEALEDEPEDDELFRRPDGDGEE